MRLVLILAALLAASPAAAQQTDIPPAVKNAEACLRQNAAAAVEAGSGAADAATFLMDYLCAGSIEAAARHARNSRTLVMLREMSAQMELEDGEEDWLAGALVDPVTGELELKSAKSAEAQGMLVGMQMMSGVFGGGQTADPRPIELRELAGRLVQEARVRR